MSKRLTSATFFSCVLLGVLVVTLSSSTAAQQVSSPPKLPPADEVPLPSKKPKETPSPRGARQLGTTSLAVSRGRGVQLRVDNRTTGRITLHGWDRDVIEARATSARGDEVVIVDKAEDDGPLWVYLKADYANLNSDEAPTKQLERPPVNSDGPIQVQLEVNVPRYIEIELIRVIHSDVEITGVETAIGITGSTSSITLKNVGSVVAQTGAGSIIIEDARGIADVKTSTGRIGIANSRGAVRAFSIAGPVEIRCVKGRVDVTTIEAAIELKSIDGDVDANATNSAVRFTGPLSDDARYYMKSMSGRVEFIIPADTRGFNATLTSYRGAVESDFSLGPRPARLITRPGADQGLRPIIQPRPGPLADPIRHRVAGRFGKVGPQITLDSFQGLVKLTKVARNSIEACK
jgi:DUF4097 and DUF4098 domain-containing protein YvlB